MKYYQTLFEQKNLAGTVTGQLLQRLRPNLYLCQGDTLEPERLGDRHPDRG